MSKERKIVVTSFDYDREHTSPSVPPAPLPSTSLTKNFGDWKLDSTKPPPPKLTLLPPATLEFSPQPPPFVAPPPLPNPFALPPKSKPGAHRLIPPKFVLIPPSVVPPPSAVPLFDLSLAMFPGTEVKRVEEKICGVIKSSHLGSGAYGDVYGIIDSDNKKKALKVPKRNTLMGINDLSEMTILSSIKHPHIMSADRLLFTECSSGIGIVLPLMNNNLTKLPIGIGWETRRRILHQILSAVECLHDNNILHLDIKPENILYRYQDGNIHIVVSDYGLSSYVQSDSEDYTYTKITRTFRPPENLGKDGLTSYGKYSDVWSIGQTALEIWNIDPIFQHNDSDRDAEKSYIYRALCRSSKDVRKYLSDYISWAHIEEKSRNEFIDVLSALLNYEWYNRSSVSEVLAMPFFDGLTPLPRSIVPRIELPERKDVDVVDIKMVVSIFNKISSRSDDIKLSPSFKLALLLLYRRKTSETPILYAYVAVYTALMFYYDILPEGIIPSLEAYCKEYCNSMYTVQTLLDTQRNLIQEMNGRIYVPSILDKIRDCPRIARMAHNPNVFVDVINGIHIGVPDLLDYDEHFVVSGTPLRYFR